MSDRYISGAHGAEYRASLDEEMRAELERLAFGGYAGATEIAGPGVELSAGPDFFYRIIDRDDALAFCRALPDGAGTHAVLGCAVAFEAGQDAGHPFRLFERERPAWGPFHGMHPEPGDENLSTLSMAQQTALLRLGGRAHPAGLVSRPSGQGGPDAMWIAGVDGSPVQMSFVAFSEIAACLPDDCGPAVLAACALAYRRGWQWQPRSARTASA